MAPNRHPKKSNRPSVSLEEIPGWFDTEEKAEAWFVARRWPRGVACPFCGGKRITAIANRKPQPYRCKDCRRHFSVKTDTPLHGSNIPLSKWAAAICLFEYALEEISSVELHRYLGLSQKTAWHMRQRIRRLIQARRARYRAALRRRQAGRRPARSKRLSPCASPGAAAQPRTSGCRRNKPTVSPK